jgi:predicted metal-dependent hydrolase
MTESSPLQVRNFHFDFDHDRPRHWHGGSVARSGLLNSLSLLFPGGERFFVDSVKQNLPRVRDAQLRREGRRFCGQEAMHQREHVNYNRMLERQGYPAERFSHTNERWLARLTRLTRPRQRLAYTCANEHFTAILAHALLSEPAWLAGADPRMAAFWRWHAGEELEHKAVAYDVYLAAGGHYVERVCFMLLATLTFLPSVFLVFACFMRREGKLLSPRAWAELRPIFTSRVARIGALLRMYLAYYRPGFHPNAIDSQPALETWQRELSQSQHYRLPRAGTPTAM